MKKFSIFQFSFVLLATIFMSGCYKLQKDYNYVPSVLDPHINMSAKDFMNSRGKAGVGSDTIFKWMQLGLDYAGIDSAEFTKPARTFIFLHNNAIRTLSSGKVTAGFFFDYPIVVKDVAGVIIKSRIDPTLDSMRPALYWTEYPQQMVKNYFLYLIMEGEYTFENLGVSNVSVKTLLTAGATADPRDSKLGYVLTKTIPNPDPAQAAAIAFSSVGGTGFDPEAKINLKLINDQNSALVVNDRTNVRTGGYFATNGKIHVYDKTVHPFRYSYP
jgi:hypothetical protein